MPLTPDPKKRSRRRLVVNIIVTVIGGVVVCMFIAALWLLYYMTAAKPLPQIGNLVRPDDKAVLIMRAASLNALPRGINEKFTQGLPTQVKLLIGKAGETGILAALTDDGKGPCLTVSCPRFPGRFWVVRRDIERRIKQEKLDYSIQYSSGMPIFSSRDSQTPFGCFAIVDCTLIRGNDFSSVQRRVQRLTQQASGGEALATFDNSSAIAGWSEQLGLLPLDAVLPKWAAYRWHKADELASALADIQCRARIKGDFAGTLARIQLTGLPEQAIDRISAWFEAHKEELYLSDVSIKPADDGLEVDFNIDFNKDFAGDSGKG